MQPPFSLAAHRRRARLSTGPPIAAPQVQRSAAQFAQQDVQVARQRGVFGLQLLDAAHRMQDGGVVTPAEPPADADISRTRRFLHAEAALFPLLLVFATVLGFVLHGNVDLQHRVITSVKDNFPAVSAYLKVGSISGSGVALAVGLAGALWAGMGVTNAAQDAMNSIWDVPLSARPDFLKTRLRGLGLLLLYLCQFPSLLLLLS